jgi:hypothetical protein
MVNSGFPETGKYGFEMVDTVDSLCRGGINRKFTPNRIDQFFRDSFSI